MKVSIVMNPYQRAHLLKPTLTSIFQQINRLYPRSDYEVIVVEDGYDGGKTMAVCAEYPVHYIQRTDRPDTAWSNPAVPLNMGIDAAKGDIIIQQNAECLNINNVVETMSKLPRGEAWFASCMALKEDGTEDKWYCHPEHRPRPDFFCGAFWKDEAPRYNEAFTEYGWEDVRWADDARAKGLTFHYLYPHEALVHHQWHPPFVGNSQSRTLYEAMKKC